MGGSTPGIFRRSLYRGNHQDLQSSISAGETITDSPSPGRQRSCSRSRKNRRGSGSRTAARTTGGRESPQTSPPPSPATNGHTPTQCCRPVASDKRTAAHRNWRSRPSQAQRQRQRAGVHTHALGLFQLVGYSDIYTGAVIGEPGELVFHSKNSHKGDRSRGGRLAISPCPAYICRLALSTPPSAERAAPKTVKHSIISTTPNLKAEKVCARSSYVATPRILDH